MGWAVNFAGRRVGRPTTSWDHSEQLFQNVLDALIAKIVQIYALPVVNVLPVVVLPVVIGGVVGWVVYVVCGVHVVGVLGHRLALHVVHMIVLCWSIFEDF